MSFFPITVGHVRRLRYGDALFLIVSPAGGRGEGRSYNVLTLCEDEASIVNFHMRTGSVVKHSAQWLAFFTVNATWEGFVKS